MYLYYRKNTNNIKNKFKVVYTSIKYFIKKINNIVIFFENLL